MNIIFEKMRDLVPFRTCIKARANGNLLVVSTPKLDIIYLNETSKDFYELCDGVKSVVQIFNEMLNTYDTPPEELKGDIVTLVRDMQWRELINLKGAYQ